MANISDIRNIVLLGHGSAGKTSLLESMLHLTGKTNRLGIVEDGSTVSDFDDIEALFFEGFAQHETDRGFVVGDEYACNRNRECVHSVLRRGSETLTVVPVPSVLSIRRAPPWRDTQLRDTASPRPVPSLRVVKKGVASLLRTSVGMPGPGTIMRSGATKYDQIQQ